MKDPYFKKRHEMVEYQIKARGIKDERILRSMLSVPRHLFIPEKFSCEAYEDYPVPIGKGQTISQPYIVAAMTEALELEGDERVLEIGTGSGYQTAILAEIVKEVFTIEREKALLDRAKEILDRLGYKNIRYKLGDGTLGWPEEAPFQRIIVTAAAPEIPPPLKDQLAESGIMVLPVGERYNQILMKVIKRKDQVFEVKELFECAFVPLVGEYGYKEDLYGF